MFAYPVSAEREGISGRWRSGVVFGLEADGAVAVAVVVPLVIVAVLAVAVFVQRVFVVVQTDAHLEAVGLVHQLRVVAVGVMVEFPPSEETARAA